MYLDKSQTHVANYCKFSMLSSVRMLTPAKQQRHGQNAGQQCVEMSLYSLIYNNKQGISSANDLIQIMNFLIIAHPTPGGGGTRYIKEVGMLVENFEIDP